MASFGRWLLIALFATPSLAFAADPCAPPVWFERPGALDDSGRLYVGVGDGRSQDNAQQRARGELAKVVSSKLHSSFELQEELSDSGAGSYSSLSISEATTVVAEVVLRGVETTAIRKVCDRYHVAVVIDRSKAADQLGDQQRFFEQLKLALDGRMDDLQATVQETKGRVTVVEDRLRSAEQAIAMLQDQLVAMSEARQRPEDPDAESSGLRDQVNELEKALELARKADEGSREQRLEELDKAAQQGLSFAEALKADQAGEFGVALRQYSSLCDEGHASACNNLGNLTRFGHGVARNPELARDLYRRACSHGEPLGCFNLASLYVLGQGGPEDTGQARKLFEQACEGGNMLACSNLGVLYSEGYGAQRDPDRARALYERACEGGEMGACTNLASLYAAGAGVTKDLARSRLLRERACEGGHPDGCYTLGAIYLLGDGVPPDMDHARSLHDQACELGSAEACSSMAMFHERGWGGAPKDPQRARALHRRACEDGVALSCSGLGRHYEEGTGGATNLPGARTLYERGCEGGNSSGCDALAELCATHNDVCRPSVSSPWRSGE